MNENKKIIVTKALYNETIDGGRISINYVINNNTNYSTIYTNFLSRKSYKRLTKSLFCFTIDGVATRTFLHYNNETDNIMINNTFSISSNGGVKENKDCATYLGVYIAERVLSKVFKNVERMPYNNPGFDFLCGRGKKIDCKSSCLKKDRPNTWQFHIFKNITADFFLCLALDNRQDLNPLHVWLIPGKDVNDKESIKISKSTIQKWSKYEQPIDKIITCCDSIR